MMIFLIALIPAFVVFIVAAITESKFKTTMAALVAMAVGVLTGNPAYMALDIGFVIVSYWISMTGIGADAAPKPQPEKPVPTPAPVALEDGSNFVGTFVVLGILGVVVYVMFNSGRGHKTPVPPPQSNMTTPSLAPPARLSLSTQPTSVPPPAAAKTAPKRPAKTPMQRCVEIKDEDKMIHCLEGLG